ncbi:ornithine--oxo-acid transaminase [Streptomyces badius]
MTDTVTPSAAASGTRSSEQLIRAEAPVLAHNYHPLPVVVARAEGAWVEDVEGRRYLDMLAGYSALNFGHRHPALIEAAHRQLDELTLTSRAFHHDRLAGFAERLAALTGLDMVLPMNTGAEAVESAVKVARKWAYEVKGVAPDRATIVVADGNFHGRTTTIVSFSTDGTARAGFGPFTPGFRVVPYNDLAALESAVDETTAAVLIEPVQGEAGVVIPDDGYLTGVRELTRRAGCLFIADEIQSGLGRTGRTLAVDHEGVVPDMLLLGKALGGGIVPVSAVVARRDVLSVLGPGEHGSTFGGNPLAAAIGSAVLNRWPPASSSGRPPSWAKHRTARWPPAAARASRPTGPACCGRAWTATPRSARAGRSASGSSPKRCWSRHPRRPYGGRLR